MPADAATDLLEDYTGYLLRLAYVHISRAAAEAFPEGPHPRVFSVLAALVEAGPLSQQRLAERLRVNRTLMVGAADVLEQEGYVERRRDPADRRSYLLHVTTEGVAALAAHQVEADQADLRMAAQLDAAERARLNALLRAVVTSDPERHVPAPLADRTGFLISMAHLMTRDRANELLRPHGVSVRQIGLMSILEANGPSSQQALADRLSVSATMITQIVDQAEARALVQRNRNPGDRRSYLVSLTPTGAERLGEGRRIAAEITREIAAPLGPGGDEELRALLRKLVTTPRPSAAAGGG